MPRREKYSDKRDRNEKKQKKCRNNRKWKIFIIFEPSTKCTTVTLNCNGWMRGWHKRFACQLVTIVITDTGSVDIVWLIELQNCFECGCLAFFSRNTSQIVFHYSRIQRNQCEQHMRKLVAEPNRQFRHLHQYHWCVWWWKCWMVDFFHLENQQHFERYKRCVIVAQIENKRRTTKPKWEQWSSFVELNWIRATCNGSTCRFKCLTK